MTRAATSTLKDTGIPWLGHVPDDWTVQPIKHSSYIKARVGWKGLTSEEFETSAYAYLVTGTDFRGQFIDWKSCYQVNEERYLDDPFIQLRDGDLLITKDGTIGKLSLVSGLDKPASLNSGIFVVRPQESYSTRFLYWVLSSRVFEDYVALTSTGSTILHLYQNVFEQFSFGFPSLEAQTSIADFLDRETAQIDALIGKQERLIELLAEKHQAIITHAVTKGLDSTAPTKPSGIPWLGEIPAHWTVTKVKHHFSATLGKMLQSANQPLESSVVIPYLRAGNIQPGGIDLNEVKQMPFTPAEAKALDLRTDDLVVVEGGAGFGRSDVLKCDLVGWGFQNHVIRVRSRASLSTGFLDLVLKMSLANGLIANLSNHATIPSLSSDKLLNLEFPAPPRDEAERICSHVEGRLIRLRDLTNSAKGVISLLRERRSALISAAVTGKIDVHAEGTGN